MTTIRRHEGRFTRADTFVFTRRSLISGLASRTTAIETASRTDVSALRAELQARNEQTLESQRGLSEQIIGQRGDMKAIRAEVDRLERQIDESNATYTRPVRSRVTRPH